ncbi:MAG: ketoacyl-ACP synthase III [Muribaculaceae bacterium]|nr:ketoacyl-ACP synthase III [Muribaculaceae bacterium]
MYINAIGHYIPPTRIGNDYFEKVNGLTPEWIEQRTGIVTRSKCAPDENVNTMAFDAVEDALSRCPYGEGEVDLIVASGYCIYDSVATVAHEVQRKWDITGAKAFAVTSACSSFINGLEIVDAFFKAGMATKALLICSEHNTYFSNDADPKCGHLWGDGAVACCLSAERVADSDHKVLAIMTEGLGQVGKGTGGVKLRPREEGITMPDGRDVFLNACRYMIYALRDVLGSTGLQVNDMTKLITHQANKRIVAQVAHMLELPMERFLNNIEELGNTGSASAALVFSQHRDDFSKGDKVALMVFGGGYSCGAFIVEI